MRCILRTCLHHNHHLRQRVVATTNTTNNAAAAALLFGVRCQSNSLIGTIHGGELSLPSDPQGGSQLSARNIAMEALQMKKLHQERGGNPMLAQQARRVLFATSIAGQSLDARSVALLLNTAVYFGMESDAKLVRECIDYCLKNDKLITVDVLPIVVTACATLKSRDAREVIEMQAQKAARNAK
ncbi:putative mitochondrial MRB1-associated protein, putative,guide RNA binding protein, partial [Trypanosoma cruzi]